jgi:nitronate monooxygenase
MWKNDLTKLLNIKYPIIQAPMAGGPTTPELVAAVSNSGGLGTIGAGYLSPHQLREEIKAVKSLTRDSFAVNLFVPAKYTVDDEVVKESASLLKPMMEKLSVPKDKPALPDYEHDLKIFYEQLKVIEEEKIPICSFTFGVPFPEVLTHLKKKSIIVIGTATNVEEAIINERSGIDAVVVQGSEAGGHRGSFHTDAKESLIGLMSLIPQTTDSVKVPVIAAGGIMDGRGLVAAKILGAKGVQMGTAFLTCQESGANQAHKDAILEANEDQTILTRSFSGKLARGIKNSFITELEGKEQVIPEYPIQNELTKQIRKLSAVQQNPEYLALWSGQSPRLAKAVSAKELINEIILAAERMVVN